MRKRILAPILNIYNIYNEKRVPRSAAALSYFITLSVFPVMICLNAMLGGLDINKSELLAVVQGVIPADTIEIILDYYHYVSLNSSALMLVLGITAMIFTSSAAFRELMVTMAGIQESRWKLGVFGTIFSFILSILFLAAIYVSFIAVIAGEWLVEIVASILPIGGFASVWLWLRFVVVFCLIYVIIYFVYFATAPRDDSTVRVPRGIGALSAAVLLVVVSIIFSWFISMSVRYTLLYGSLASIIILMVWLYVCCNILILGNVINVVIYRGKKKKMHPSLEK